MIPRAVGCRRYSRTIIILSLCVFATFTEHLRLTSLQTEEDVIQIAGAGLNWVRIPIPYWAIETWEGEPFLERVCWHYILRAFEWARKYGLRIYLDLHTVPGSQNGASVGFAEERRLMECAGYNHSGKLGQINFMKGVMGLANAQRTLSYIRIITEFISQKEYKDLIPLFGIVNEVGPFI